MEENGFIIDKETENSSKKSLIIKFTFENKSGINQVELNLEYTTNRVLINEKINTKAFDLIKEGATNIVVQEVLTYKIL